MMIHEKPYMSSSWSARQEVINLNYLMNNDVKRALSIPDSVTWGSQSGAVFDYLRTDFMKPVTEES